MFLIMSSDFETELPWPMSNPLDIVGISKLPLVLYCGGVENDLKKVEM